MKTSIKNEWPCIVATTLPFIYLAYVWRDLPEKVPMHWNISGEIDRYGSKTELLIIPFVMPLLIYLIFLLVPYIDPKKQIGSMGKKFHQLKFVFVLFMSLLSIFIIYSAYTASLSSMNHIFIGVGIVFAVLGNYMQSIKPNYFIGIRTPWTLESNEVWKLTHRFAGKLWLGGGILIAFMALFMDSSIFFWLFIGITIIISLIPLVYSYIKFKELETE
jgi:uncharacterized membrane protein